MTCRRGGVRSLCSRMTDEELALLPMRWRHLAIMRFGRWRLTDPTFTEAVTVSLIQEENGYQVYRLEIFPGGAYFLRYSCPSTGKTYASGIPHRIGVIKSISPRACMEVLFAECGEPKIVYSGELTFTNFRQYCLVRYRRRCHGYLQAPFAWYIRGAFSCSLVLLILPHL